MVEFEADDALAAAAAMAAADPRVEQVVVCTPDKDLAQCVRGDRVVQLDRRTREVRDEAGVRQKFGVAPASIPDWLALVGDSADGYPGAARLGREVGGDGARPLRAPRGHPGGAAAWDVSVRGAPRLAATLAAEREQRAALPRARHAAPGCADRRGRGRPALDGAAARVRGVGRAAGPAARRAGVAAGRGARCSLARPAADLVNSRLGGHLKTGDRSDFLGDSWVKSACR